MESDGGHEDLPDSGADTSEAKSVAGTDPGKDEVEPEVTVRRHNYNLRPKRRAPVPDGEDVQTKEIEIAPGAGVVADKTMSVGVMRAKQGRGGVQTMTLRRLRRGKTRSIRTLSDASRRGRLVLATVSSTVPVALRGTSP